jgi:hypothetical protein
VVITLQWFMRLLAADQVTLGILFWTGNSFTPSPLHMLSGLLLVLAARVDESLPPPGMGSWSASARQKTLSATFE